jgi:hypothetical protein
MIKDWLTNSVQTTLSIWPSGLSLSSAIALCAVPISDELLLTLLKIFHLPTLVASCSLHCVLFQFLTNYLNKINALYALLYTRAICWQHKPRFVVQVWHSLNTSRCWIQAKYECMHICPWMLQVKQENTKNVEDKKAEENTTSQQYV